MVVYTVTRTRIFMWWKRIVRINLQKIEPAVCSSKIKATMSKNKAQKTASTENHRNFYCANHFTFVEYLKPWTRGKNKQSNENQRKREKKCITRMLEMRTNWMRIICARIASNFLFRVFGRCNNIFSIRCGVFSLF